MVEAVYYDLFINGGPVVAMCGLLYIKQRSMGHVLVRIADNVEGVDKENVRRELKVMPND